MNKYNAYQGHETWWNAVRMDFKMVVLTFKYCLAIQVLLFIVISKIYMPEGSAKFAFEYMRLRGVIVLNNPFSKFHDDRVDAVFDAILWRLFVLFVASGIPSYLLRYPMLLDYFKRRAKEQAQEKYVRGAPADYT